MLGGDFSDDGHGSITHPFSWVDDVTVGVPLVDLKFFCNNLAELATPVSLKLNPLKTCILTSCNGESILPTLHATDTNPSLALEIESTITTYSITKADAPHNTTAPIEITSGV